jgi:hypothetical protein
MSDENQIHIPPSFLALFADARQRLSEPIAVVRERYEICEDLANHLIEHGNDMLHRIGVTEDEVLRRCHAGLLVAESGVSAAEAGWIVQRLAELLGWPWVEPDPLRA